MPLPGAGSSLITASGGQADVLLAEALQTSDRKIEASRQLIDTQDASVGGDDVLHLVGDARLRLGRPGTLRHPVCQRTGGTLPARRRVRIHHDAGDRSAQVRVLERLMGVLDQGWGAQRACPCRPEKGSDGPSSAFQLVIGDACNRAVQGDRGFPVDQRSCRARLLTFPELSRIFKRRRLHLSYSRWHDYTQRFRGHWTVHD